MSAGGPRFDDGAGTLFAPRGPVCMGMAVSAPRVVVVSENAETVDGLQTYFVGVGISARSARSLGAALSLPESTTAVVVFPDDFRAVEVVESLLALRKKCPRLLLLLVTGEPRRYSEALAVRQGASSLLILPKPVFGWAIVDAIRSHAEALA